MDTSKNAEEACAMKGTRLYQPRTKVAIKYLKDLNKDISDPTTGQKINWPFPYLWSSGSSNGYIALGMEYDRSNDELKYM